MSFPTNNDDDIQDSLESEGKRKRPVRCTLLEFANCKESSHPVADALKNLSGSLYRIKLFCAEFSPPAGVLAVNIVIVFSSLFLSIYTWLVVLTLISFSRAHIHTPRTQRTFSLALSLVHVYYSFPHLFISCCISNSCTSCNKKKCNNGFGSSSTNHRSTLHPEALRNMFLRFVLL